MKKKVYGFSVLLLAMLAGCAKPTASISPEPPNQRIIERDLTRPYISEIGTGFYSLPADLPVLSPEMTASADDETGLVDLVKFFIEFPNESIVLDPISIPEIVEVMTPDDRLLLIGHSHGHSSYGTGTLAVGRANSVVEALVSQGIERDRIHSCAFWSNKLEDNAPTKGVEVVVVDRSRINDFMLGFIS